MRVVQKWTVSRSGSRAGPTQSPVEWRILSPRLPQLIDLSLPPIFSLGSFCLGSKYQWLLRQHLSLNSPREKNLWSSSSQSSLFFSLDSLKIGCLSTSQVLIPDPINYGWSTWVTWPLMQEGMPRTQRNRALVRPDCFLLKRLWVELGT